MKYCIALLGMLLVSLNVDAQMNIRVRGNGVDISNVGSTDYTEYKLIYPLPTRTEWEKRYYTPGKFHLFGKRPAAIVSKDFATTPIADDYFDKGDTRKDYSLDSFSADKAGYVTIAVPTDALNVAGWTRAFGTFNSTITDYYLYRYYYTEVGTWVDIPETSDATPSLLFADKGCLKFDNPLPVSDLAEGVVITNNMGDYNKGPYMVDPFLLVMPNGDYIAGAHAELSFELQYGPDSEMPRHWISKDKGKTWSRLTKKKLGVLHASTFYHDGALYALGDVEEGYGAIVKSTDGGQTWSDPVRLNFKVRNSPSHVVVCQERYWLAMESPVSAISASITSDLMDPNSWILAKRQDRNRTGNEADMIVTRDGAPVIIPKGNRKIRILSPTETIVDNEVDEFKLTGSNSGKYSIIYDPISDKYWALTSYSPIPGNIRCGIALSSSTDLKNFTIERQVIQGKSVGFHGFNYPFLEIDGNDIIFVSRTAWENEYGQAQRWHDADMLTFHRIRNFRGDVGTKSGK
jgi:hypothetical protein